MEEVAVKWLRTAGLPPQKVRAVLEEVEIYMHMDHPNICRLVRVYEQPDGVYLCMEHCSGGELRTRLATLLLWEHESPLPPTNS